jgi:predicted nucleotidyltransferase component of viral defense system
MTIATHRRVLLALLKRIYTHASLAPILALNGGTCLYFLHSLPRFSVDLDFNIIGKEDRFNPAHLEQILRRELTVTDSREKKHTWFWNGVYEPGQWNVQVEVSKREFEDEYEQRDLYGLKLNALRPDYQLSHKLCAITDRPLMQNRDLFDTHFLLKRHVSIVDSIIEERTRLTTGKYLQSLLQFIPANISSRGILDGLGELLDTERKKWVRLQLLSELLFLLESRCGEYT